MNPISPHPAPETIAALAEGRVRRADLPPLTDHLDGCAACREELRAATETLNEDRAEPPGANRWWIGAVAALLAAIALAIPFAMQRRSPIARLIATLPADRRPVEPRLAIGRLGWAPYRGPMRAAGNDAADDPAAMKRIGEAGDVAARADRERSAGLQHDAGVAMLIVDKPSAAVQRLREAAASAPGDSRAWSDLAAAQYAEAVSLGRPSIYPEALASADRALRIEPRLPEALFNRALILERLALTAEARAAWERYLEVDPSSPWAVEARDRLRRLPRETGESLFKRELPRLEAAVAARDADQVRQFVDRYRQQARAYGEAEWLGQWGEATLHGAADAAARPLALARATGEALAASSGEQLLRDAVAAIDAADATGRHTLAVAHDVYRRARIAYSRGEPRAAEPELRRAAALFAQAGSPMALVARYYAASARLDQQDLPAARAELTALGDELASKPAYAAAAAQVQWELGLAAMTDGDWLAAQPLLGASEAAFRRLGERSNAAFVDTLLAGTLASLGKPDESWAARVRSFGILSAEGRGIRLPVSLGGAARMDLLMGRLDAARAMLGLEVDANRAAGNEAMVADALVRQAVLGAKLGDPSAETSVREAGAAAARIGDPALRARALADVDFAAGAVALARDPVQAKASLTRAIDAYRERGLPLYLPEALLLRARAERRSGDAAGAARDLDDGIAALERHSSGTGVLDAGTALFEEAIALALDRGDAPRAFALAEEARGSSVDVPTLQQRLRGSDAAVLEVVALPGELAAFCVTADRFEMARHPATTPLADTAIAPFETILDGSRELIVVPDRTLDGVSFAALFDPKRQRYLVERLPVARAGSAGALLSDAQRAPHSLLTVSLPTGEAAGSVALPEAAAEAADLRPLYGEASEIAAEHATFPAFVAAAARADVVHVSGHTERQPGDAGAALVFAGRPVTWSTIAAAPLPRKPVVILAACESLRSPDAHGLSLGAAFAAAGARDVIGTLIPIADADARELFAEVHRQLAAGLPPAEALRNAQLREIAAGREAWRSAAVLTTCISKGGVQ